MSGNYIPRDQAIAIIQDLLATITPPVAAMVEQRCRFLEEAYSKAAAVWDEALEMLVKAAAGGPNVYHELGERLAQKVLAVQEAYSHIELLT